MDMLDMRESGQDDWSFEGLRDKLPGMDGGAFLVYDLMGAADFAVVNDNSSLGEMNARNYERVREGIRKLLPRDIDALITHVDELESRASHCREEGKGMMLRGEQYQAGADLLRRLLLEALEEAGRRDARGIIHAAVIMENARVEAPESMEELEALGEMDPELVRGKLVPDKKAIRKALQEGRELPGCQLVATRHLRFGMAGSIRK